MKNNNPQCSFNSKSFVSSVTSCARTPTPVNCLVKPLAKITYDPCLQQHMAHQITNDPYYQHMPKHDAAAATIYAAKMGGEHHQTSECEIM